MINYIKINSFDWDEGNINKNLIKHGISCQEAEEIFLDSKAIHLEDDKHSIKESRYIIIGRNFSEKILTAIYMIRKNKIRIISVRNANKKEKDWYLS